jgi:hypothetical protein
MKTKLFNVILSLTLFIFSSCVKDEVFIDNSGPSSEIALVINEVMSNMGDPNPDWIEIYNPTDAEVDMSGFGVYDKPDAKYTFAAGTKIAAKGYLVIVCDKILAAADPATYANFGISSGGESVYLVDAADAVIDQVDVPAMSLGISYARIPDGGDVLENANPTKAAANSNTNEPPVIEADTLKTGMVNDNERYQYDIVVKDASGISTVKLWIQTTTETYYLDMAPLGGGEYRLLFPLLAQGAISYYIEAADKTGLITTFRAKNGSPISLNVSDGLALFNSVGISNSNPVGLEDVVVTISAYDKSGVSAVRLYYLVNSEDANNKVTVDLSFANGVWTGTIPGQTEGAVIRYYIRATDNASVKSYYPVEELNSQGMVIGDFNHDVATTWPQINVAPLVLLNQLVINEIQASGTPYDYIELYNGSTAAIDISGYKVYDSGGVGAAYIIPASTTIAAGGFYLVETGSGSTQGQFGISSSGEDITLANTSDVVVDQLLKINWPGTPLVARKKDSATKWVVPAAETKGVTNN